MALRLDVKDTWLEESCTKRQANTWELLRNWCFVAEGRICVLHSTVPWAPLVRLPYQHQTRKFCAALCRSNSPRTTPSTSENLTNHRLISRRISDIYKNKCFLLLPFYTLHTMKQSFQISGSHSSGVVDDGNSIRPRNVGIYMHFCEREVTFGNPQLHVPPMKLFGGIPVITSWQTVTPRPRKTHWSQSTLNVSGNHSETSTVMFWRNKQSPITIYTTCKTAFINCKSRGNKKIAL
jgi:hypothetical protein